MLKRLFKRKGKLVPVDVGRIHRKSEESREQNKIDPNVNAQGENSPEQKRGHKESPISRTIEKAFDKLPSAPPKNLTQRKSIFYKHKKLGIYFEKAGYSKDFFANIHRKIFLISLGVSAIATILFLIIFINKFMLQYLIGISILALTFGTAIIFFIILASFYWYIDMRIYARSKEIEAMLPEYLLLVSSNMRAGMLIDQAMLYAARPKFGSLSKEVDRVIKDVTAGKEMSVALRDLAEKYESLTLRRSLMIIIEGIESGGKMANMINRVAVNLSELAIQKKEMSAAVTTYAIFITFASIVAAPALMALAGQILKVVRGLISTLSQTGAQKSSAMSFMAFSVPSLTDKDFMIFAVVMLTITAMFSAIILSVIQKGDMRRGLRYIPIYIIISLAIYFACTYMFSSFFDSMIMF